MPLVDENKEPFDSRTVRGKSKKQLLKKKILLDIKGVYTDEKPDVDAILLSHPHPDHYGLLPYVNRKIPIYMSKGCEAIIKVSHLFNQTDCELKNVKIIKAWKKFRIKDFQITPYLVDHSGLDAMAFLIESGSKRVYYSGDFRAHGRKAKTIKKMIKKPIKGIDCMLLEGSLLGREAESCKRAKYKSEFEVEKKLAKIFKKKEKLAFVACSTQNIDRLVSIYKACRRTNCTFVIDPYTAYILDKAQVVSKKKNIPRYNWRNIRVFFNPYQSRILRNKKTLYKYKSAKIQYDEIKKRMGELVIKDNSFIKGALSKRTDIRGSIFIYSMWSGYMERDSFKRTEAFLKENNIRIKRIHTSGHAYVEDLQRFVDALKSKEIIPIHTHKPGEYGIIFKDAKIRCLNDGEVYEIP
jgi:ribonuclease J